MSYETIRLKLSGSALLMHSGRLADPLDDFARAMKSVSKKRAKTDADYAELGRLEFLGSLWLSGGEPCIPGEALEAALCEGARKLKRGQQAKAGILCDSNYPLLYDGPRDPDALWDDPRFRLRCGVRVQRNRVIRTRPRFDRWHCFVDIKYLVSLLNRGETIEIAERTGEIVGLGDWRPKFGRFAVEQV